MIAQPDHIMRIEFAPKQAEAYRLLHQSDVREVLFGGAKGGGKALAVDTPILTLAGFKAIGEIIPGDYVFGADGHPALVLATSPIMQGHKCYELGFDDGATIVADAEHLWFTQTLSERNMSVRRTDKYRAQRRKTRAKRGTGARPDLALSNAQRIYTYLRPTGGSTKTTNEIVATLWRSNDGASNHKIACSRPLQYQAKDLRIDPYVLGAWLGDGYSSRGAITIGQSQIVGELACRGYVIAKHKAKYACGIKGSQHLLRQLDLLKNKHIPDCYLAASVEQRLELLRGLMDTDGYIKPGGNCVFSVISKELVDGVQRLLRGLGIKCALSIKTSGKCNGKPYNKPVYCLHFSTNLPITTLEKKKKRLEAACRVRRSATGYFITSARQVSSVPVKCISVDSPGNLYLAGTSLIPTHNSVLGCYWAYLRACEIIREYRITRRQHPIPVAFMGRKRSVDFTNTTLETWKRFIPPERYEIKEHNKEIVIDNRVKLDFGGLDDPEQVNKFNSAEYAFYFIDQAEEVSKDAIGLLRATLRMIINGQPVPGKALFTANPAQCWLKDEFISNIHPRQRFVRALPGDNKWTGESYIKVLEAAFKHRPELLAAYRDGNWDAFEGEDQLILDRWVGDAELREPYIGGKIIACDPARFGDNETVIFALEGTEIVDKVVYGKARTTKISGKMQDMSRQLDNCPCIVDEIGVGAGVVDELYDLGREVVGFNSSAKPTEVAASKKRPRFYNLRAEAWWHASEMFATGEVSVKKMYPLLRGQLCTPHYEFRVGKIIVESKDDIKERIGSSPDHADTYVMGLWGLKQIASGGRMTPRESRDLREKYRPPVMV